MVPVIQKAFRDTRRTTLWVAIGVAVYALLILSFYPSIGDQQSELDSLMDSYPDALISVFTGGDADQDLFSPAYFIQSQLMTFYLLIISGILIGQIFNGFTNAERNGSMDMLLALPISRRELLLGRVVNTVITALLILTTVFITLAAGAVIWEEDLQLDLVDVALGTYLMFLPIMVFTGLTYLLVSVVPSRRRFVGAVVYLFLIGSWLFYGFTGVVGEGEALRPLFVMHYYNFGEILNNGVSLSNVFILAAVATLLIAIAWWRIDHKQMGI